MEDPPDVQACPACLVYRRRSDSQRESSQERWVGKSFRRAWIERSLHEHEQSVGRRPILSPRSAAQMSRNPPSCAACQHRDEEIGERGRMHRSLTRDQSIMGTLESVAAKGGLSGDGSGERGPTSSSSARTKLDTVSRSKALSPLCACANPASVWQARVKLWTSSRMGAGSMGACSHTLNARGTRKVPS